MGDFKTDNPSWETVLDIDALGAEENESWVYHGSYCLPPEEVRCLIELSRGGQDAGVVREFDLETKSFIDESEAFALP